ncbi:putative protein disulfide-isomerase YIL005W [Kluyveromyces marxianus]|uniref:Thioredoxin domain-containing protein n=2 Tax=Kluyveromyces marxianus TaxID=4911 RepID=W0TG14_KLUMD|nr:uncharacterized protein KLMA_50395 [Kluyveromyces marxianus DMKU3-1042]QGN16769.1 putative protein disulfide-isomerase YIL005W [Kluyveromyces marxianus]BAO41049.1 putative protein disulfide-isomerase YIL005W [Kluyveromyces marxianus DMKU3-1042]
MRFLLFFIQSWWWLLVFVTATETSSNPSLKFPEPLTEENFKSTISENLHIVEFFSPYCPHCKSLAPIWEATYFDFYEESQKLNISFHQVNCIESGDLCEQEKIMFYPNIRLYGPDGYIKDYPGGSVHAKEDLINFARQEALDADNLDLTKLRSKSKFATDADLLKLLSEPQTEPYLVSFWPSTDFEDVDSSYSFKDCEKCSQFQRIWKLVSNKADSEGITTIHFNCANNTKNSKNDLICRELSYDSLTNERSSREDRYPRVALILPHFKSGSFVKFPYGKLQSDSYSIMDFAVRTLHNSKVPEIDRFEIQNFVEQPMKDILSPDIEDDKMILVFNYDPKTVVPEDTEFLEQLIEPLTYLPNVYLYKCPSDLMALSHNFYKKLYEKFNVDPAVEFSENRFIASSITQLPTFYLFKKSTFTPIIFPGFSTTETRDIKTILDWLTINSMPLVNELTPRSYRPLIGFEPEIYDKAVIQVINRSSNKFEKGSRKLVEGLRDAAHSYEVVRDEIVYDSLQLARDDKNKAVDKLKSKNVPSRRVVEAMRKEIDHIYDHKALFLYLDINSDPFFLDDLGLNANRRDYKTGDILIFDKKNGFYYEKDAKGEYLTLKTLPRTLAAINFPQRYPELQIERVRVVTPFAVLYNLADTFREATGLYYLLVPVMLFTLYKLPKVIQYHKLKKRYAAKRDTHGILGAKLSKETKLID